MNPLSDFAVNGTNLDFKNLGTEHEIGAVEGYRYQWFAFDNATQESKPLRGSRSRQFRQLRFPIPDHNGKKFLMVRIESISADVPEWKKPVEIYLRTASELKIVGVDRQI